MEYVFLRIVLFGFLVYNEKNESKTTTEYNISEPSIFGNVKDNKDGTGTVATHVGG